MHYLKALQIIQENTGIDDLKQIENKDTEILFNEKSYCIDNEENITGLNLENVPLETPEFLGQLDSLEVLDLSNTQLKTDISFLSGLKKLQELSLKNNPNIDYQQLVYFENLDSLIITINKSQDSFHIHVLNPIIPNLITLLNIDITEHISHA